jgi:signal transduction histidine kinase
MRGELDDDEVVTLNRLTLVSQLLGGTAHELNNALQIIGASAELLGGVQELNDASGRAIDRIQTQSTRAAAVIHDLLEFARDRGDTIRHVSLKDVVIRAVQMRGFAARRAGIVLAFEASAAPAAMVPGNSGLLRQAVLNLLINAEQALSGTPGATIGIELTEDSGHAVLRITDNGRGIDSAVAGSLFEPFVTSRLVPDTTGLGLAATRIIATRHGGTVSLTSRETGCCARLVVPLRN